MSLAPAFGTAAVGDSGTSVVTAGWRVARCVWSTPLICDNRPVSGVRSGSCSAAYPRRQVPAEGPQGPECIVRGSARGDQTIEVAVLKGAIDPRRVEWFGIGQGLCSTLRDLDVAPGDRPEDPRADQRGRAQLGQQRIPIREFREHVDARRGIIAIAGIECRIEVVPETSAHSLDQRESRLQPRQTLQLQQGTGDRNGDAQVLGTGHQPLAKLQDLTPVRLLGGDHTVTHTPFGGAGGGLDEGQEIGIVFQVRA